MKLSESRQQIIIKNLNSMADNLGQPVVSSVECWDKATDTYINVVCACLGRGWYGLSFMKEYESSDDFSKTMLEIIAEVLDHLTTFRVIDSFLSDDVFEFQD